MPTIPKPRVPQWLDPEQASVTEDPLTQALRQYLAPVIRTVYGDPADPNTAMQTAMPTPLASVVAKPALGAARTVREQARRAVTQGNPDFPDYPAPDQEQLIDNIAKALRSRNTREVEKALMAADVHPKQVLRIDPETLGPLPQQMPERVYARADEAGYPLRVFHASRNPNLTSLPKAVTSDAAYDFGFHAASEPATSNRFIAGPTLGNLGKGDTLYPLVARVPESRILDMPDLGLWSSPLSWQARKSALDDRLDALTKSSSTKPTELAVLQQLQHEASRQMRSRPGAPVEGAPYTEWQQYMKDLLEAGGFDAIRYANDIEGLGEPSYLFLKPEQLRSPFAKFDPAKRETNNILASVLAALGLGATQLPEGQ